MTDIKDGGPAFPTSTAAEGPFGGMTLRDWFAGQALIGLLHPGWEKNSLEAPRQAYLIADVMLAERDNIAWEYPRWSDDELDKIRKQGERPLAINRIKTKDARR